MDRIKIKNYHATTDESYVQISGEFVSLLVDMDLYRLRKDGKQKLGEISEVVYLLLSAGF